MMLKRSIGEGPKLTQKAAWLAVLTLLVCGGCGPREFVGGRAAICHLGLGASTREVLDQCGIPDGLRYQPKVAEGLLRPKLCSAPVYIYPGAMIAFGCSGEVSELSVGNPPAPIGVELGIEALEAELAENRNTEAAVIGLISLDPKNSMALDHVSRLETSGDSVAKEAASKARKIISSRSQ